MTVCEVLARAHALLQDCSIPMKDAVAAGEAMNLIVFSIAALQNATKEEKEEQK